MMFVIGLIFAVVISAVFLVARMEWVLRVRIDVMAASLIAYGKLPSYDEMVWKFWIWDASRFLAMESENETQKRARRGNALLALAALRKAREEGPGK